LIEKVKKEQEETKEVRQSLTELEEKLKNSDNDNLKQLQKLDQEKKNIQKKVASLEIDYDFEKDKVVQLESEINEKKSEAQKLGITLISQQKTIQQLEKENK